MADDDLRDTLERALRASIDGTMSGWTLAQRRQAVEAAQTCTERDQIAVVLTIIDAGLRQTLVEKRKSSWQRERERARRAGDGDEA